PPVCLDVAHRPRADPCGLGEVLLAGPPPLPTPPANATPRALRLLRPHGKKNHPPPHRPPPPPHPPRPPPPPRANPPPPPAPHPNPPAVDLDVARPPIADPRGLGEILLGPAPRVTQCPDKASRSLRRPREPQLDTQRPPYRGIHCTRPRPRTPLLWRSGHPL